jgi:hypothetical protein
MKVILFLALIIPGQPPVHQSAPIATLEDCAIAVVEILHNREPPPNGSLQAGCALVGQDVKAQVD